MDLFNSSVKPTNITNDTNDKGNTLPKIPQTSNDKPVVEKTSPGMSKLSDYYLYNQLGQGTFGIVTKAKQKSSGKLVALKQFIIKDKKDGFPITAFREITIMKKLRNVNILQIIDMIYDSNDAFFFTVSPYISSDLNGLLNNPRINLTLSQIKCLLKQILLGINYIHQAGYLHRDIKTANILLDHFGIVKIADFGLARLFHGKPPSKSDSPPGGGKFEYTGLVVTRWYRPPELLLGDRKYTTAVDMWGIGCVFGELFLKQPILEGKSDVHQAEIIFQLLGSPTVENFPNCHVINRNNIDLKTNYPRTLESKFEPLMHKDVNAIELLAGMLTLDPMKRFNAVKCLDSEFFKAVPLPCTEKELSNLEESHESDIKRFKDESKSSAHHPYPSSSNPPINQHHQIPSQPSISSLNHSKYGIDAPSYMNRENSTSNIPNEQPRQKSQPPSSLSVSNHSHPYSRQQPPSHYSQHQSQPPQRLEYTGNDYEDPNDYSNFRNRPPRRQIDMIQQQIQYSDPHRSSSRRYKNSYDDYYEEEGEYHDRRKKIRTSNHSDIVSGKELYGVSSAGESSQYNVLSKIMHQGRQSTNKEVNNKPSQSPKK